MQRSSRVGVEPQIQSAIARQRDVCELTLEDSLFGAASSRPISGRRQGMWNNPQDSCPTAICDLACITDVGYDDILRERVHAAVDAGARPSNTS
jgi:hypothetical protein